MKITDFKTLIFLLLAFPAISQPIWRGLSGLPLSWRYEDIHFLNADLGWAADGVGSSVFKTTDGGLNWAQQNVPPELYYRNIEFLNENIGFLGSLSPNFYKTNNGGENWELVAGLPPEVQAICGLDAVGDHTIYGCGAWFGPAYVIKSTNSGATWQYIDMSAYAETLVEVLFVDENTGFASGGGVHGAIILKTVNGGGTWSEIYRSDIYGEYVWKLQRLFSNPQVVFGSVESIAPLSGKLLKSTDGGVTWVSKDVPDTDIQAVGFITENHGWMGGHNSGFLETFDAGTTWNDTGFGMGLNRMQIFDGNLVYCSGEMIYKYSDETLSTVQVSDQKPKNLNVTIAPNPIKENLNLAIDFQRADHLVITIIDSHGKVLKKLPSETISAAGRRNYSFLFPYKSGTYYLSLHYDFGAQAEKIIKK